MPSPDARLAARQRLIVALDVSSLAEALSLADALADEVSFFKVGLELYTAAGPEAVRALRRRGHRVFLDLKLFDVPETVKRAARAAASSGAELLTVHEGGGTVAAAVAGIADCPGSPMRVLAVTVLTSFDATDLLESGCTEPVESLVLRRARRARAAGAWGLVASPLEAVPIKRALGPECAVVTPGIRPAGADAGDQKRLSTPAAAIAAGADFLVVGRPISRAPQPRTAAAGILIEMQAAFDRRPGIL